MISLLVPAMAAACQLLPVSRHGHGIPDDPFSFQVGAGEVAQTVAWDGKGTSVENRLRSFALPVENAKIQTLYVAGCGPTQVFVYELGDEEEGWSIAVGLDNAGRVRYRTPFGGFNLAKPAIEGRYAYLATIGCVGKLDLTTGRLLWSHRDLYQQDHAFVSFDEPSIGPANVIFRAQQPDNGGVKTLVIDKNTGQIRGRQNGG